MEALADRLPLVIGVTGHRDLRAEDVPKLEQAVAGVIERLRRDYLGQDGQTPIVIVSALAEGADRLAARVALAQGAVLVTPMPMPVEEYRRDFEPGLTPGNAVEFDALLAQAIAAPVMPFVPGNSLEGVRSDRKMRAAQYRAVGIFIAQNCDVLLALWDGRSGADTVGGTAEVVAFKRDGIPLAVSGSARGSLDASEVGPVIQIITPRQNGAGAGAAGVREAQAVALLPFGHEVVRRYRGNHLSRSARAFGATLAQVVGRRPADIRSRLSAGERKELDAWETFAALSALTREFNREAAALMATPGGVARVESNRDALFSGVGVPFTTAKERATASAPRACRLYGVADTLAQDWQAQFKRDWRLIFAFSYAAVLCFAFATNAGEAPNWLLAGYSLCFLIIFALFLRARFGAHQERFLDYRALAEALRVAVYWKLVGIGSDWLPRDGRTDEQSLKEANFVGMLARSYPIKQPNELAWVKNCLRGHELIEHPGSADEGRALDPLAYSIARNGWVEGQCAFFAKQGSRHQHSADVFGVWTMILLVVTPFIFVPLLAMNIGIGQWAVMDLHNVLAMMSGLMPALAAAFMGYSEYLALRAQARQYDRMRLLFQRAHELLPEHIDAVSAPLAQALYAELGAEAMKENAEWVATYRQRPIQPH